mmetsp:Transcript_28836/g.47763  ORF Transcript_28836/g.47763 Transcript_28836/m.47763 type:complete len:132 (-) Transcript_28836:130-525(-)
MWNCLQVGGTTRCPIFPNVTRPDHEVFMREGSRSGSSSGSSSGSILPKHACTHPKSTVACMAAAIQPASQSRFVVPDTGRARRDSQVQLGSPTFVRGCQPNTHEDSLPVLDALSKCYMCLASSRLLCVLRI